MEVGDLATWVSVVISVGAAVWAYKAVDISKRSHDLQLQAWVDQHFIGVRDWASEVTDSIAIAIQITAAVDSADARDRSFYVKAKLSALVDRGRWYFPNQWAEKYGEDKEPAYRGIRQPVLDCVVFAYDALSELSASNSQDVRERLIHLQRLFVSYIQERLDPGAREYQIESITAEFGVAKRLRNIRNPEQ